MAAKKVKAPKVDASVVLSLRKKLGLNQKDFWTPLGITQSGGSRYEGGRNIPKPAKRLIFIMHMSGIQMTADEKALIAAI